ncbi:hypothetical protein QGP82_32875 [Leptothoe sp. LEGE 181152]|nr:hypothetical protein [Leptothoe sp. LEGE 181152]
MTRLPRHASKVKPPLRGRAATKQYRGEFAPVASVRRPLHPYGSPQELPCKEIDPPTLPPKDVDPPITPPHKTSLFADIVQFYKSFARLLETLNQPWQWLLALATVLSGLLLLNRLL